MKTNHITAALLLLLLGTAAAAQTPDLSARISALKVRELNMRKEALQQQIAVEDAKRNQSVDGVSPEEQERLNDQQDSICLQLRSDLVSVELQLKELVPDQTTATLVNQYNQLLNMQPADGEEAGSEN